MERGAGADGVHEVGDVLGGHVVVGMRIETVSLLRGKGLLYDFVLEVVHGVAVAVHDHAAHGAEDGGAAPATVRGQAVTALALPDDGLPAHDLAVWLRWVVTLAFVVCALSAAPRGA